MATDIVWHIDLPQSPLFTKGPPSAEFQDGTIRTEMDAGPPKVRSRFSAVMETYSIEILCESVAQRNTFVSFYKSTCKFGAKSFLWKHPQTLVDNTEMRFASGSPVIVPVYKQDCFAISFKVEVLP